MNNIQNMTLINYLEYLINKIYKILPLKENNNNTLITYLSSLQVELVGSMSFIEQLRDNVQYLSVLNTIQYLIDYDFNLITCKREVFKIINIIENIKSNYSLKIKEGE
jgi:hypothetical protein